MKKLLFILMLLLFTTSSIGQDIQLFSEQPIFLNGQDGYACYRIPAIVKSVNGDLLAFAEGRVHGCNDFGDVDIVMRRSTDNGKNWQELVVLIDHGEMQSGNPAPVVDELDPRFRDGRIFLFYNNGIASEHATRQGKGLRTVHFITSIDHGKTWFEGRDITLQVHRPKRPDISPIYNFEEDWRSYANTPGHGLQLNKGEYKGRLFIPANHSSGPPMERFMEYNAHAFYSDDHGATFQLSQSIHVPSSNESIAVELSNGNIMQNIREQSGDQRKRLVALSSDGGTSWNRTYFDSTLITPVCQASILSYEMPTGEKAILFSNPHSKDKRRKMTVMMSQDEGVTWPVKRLVRSGASAYSDLVQQDNGLIGLLYEHGNDGGIHYANFNYSWLIGSENRID